MSQYLLNDHLRGLFTLGLSVVSVFGLYFLILTFIKSGRQR